MLLCLCYECYSCYECYLYCPSLSCVEDGSESLRASSGLTDLRGRKGQTALFSIRQTKGDAGQERGMEVTAEDAAAAAAAGTPSPPGSSPTRAPFDFRRPWTPPPRARTPQTPQQQQHAEASSSSSSVAAATAAVPVPVASTSAMAIDATSAASASRESSYSSSRPRRIPGDTAASIVLIGFRGVGVVDSGSAAITCVLLAHMTY